MREQGLEHIRSNINMPSKKGKDDTTESKNQPVSDIHSFFDDKLDKRGPIVTRQLDDQVVGEVSYLDGFAKLFSQLPYSAVLLR